jgi:hypothetical protein
MTDTLTGPVNNHQHPDSTMPHPAPTAAAVHVGDEQAGPGPLTGGWITLAVVIGVMAALIALGGMVLSFRAVSTEMAPAFGARWSWLVPIVVDLTVFVFSGVDLVLARMNMTHPLARWTVYGATAGTVYLNYSAGTALPGRIAHVLMPSIWVVFVELMRHLVRHQAQLSTGTRREPIPTARWLVSPWPTLKLWRRMVLWREHSYTAALATERRRLGAIATARHTYGRRWRSAVGPLTRLRIALGEVDAVDLTATGPGPTSTPAPTATAGPISLKEAVVPLAAPAGPAPVEAEAPAPPAAAKARTAGRKSTADNIAALRAAHPELTQVAIAKRLKLTDRTVRKYWADTAPETA